MVVATHVCLPFLAQRYVQRCYSAAGFESKMPVFLVFLCVLACIFFLNYRSWQAEILQEHAEGCIKVDLQKKIRQDFFILWFCRGHKFKTFDLVPVPNSAQTLDMD